MSKEGPTQSKPFIAFFWSAISTGGNQFIGLLFSIFLARILPPEDFGNMAIIVVIALIANVFVDSGLSHALIREQKVSKVDFDSIFYFSIVIAFICAIFIYYSAGYIADIFNSPILKKLTEVVSFSPIIMALMTINTTIITKQLNFKLKSKLAITSMLISGSIGITMAYRGYGVWSLLTMQMLGPAILMVLMYSSVSWRPEFHFSYKALLKYISFGMKVSLSNFANIIYTKSYVLVVGNSVSTEQAGYFARADGLKDLPTNVLGKIILRVAYPFLSKSQDQPANLRADNIRIIKFTALISVPIMFGLAAIVEPLIVSLIGERWLPSAAILFYLCFAGVLMPFDLLNMNVIKVHGKMNLYLILELVKILLVTPVLYLGAVFGMKTMLFAIIGHTVASFFISAIFSGRLIKYNYKEYLQDILQPVLLSILMFLIVNLIKDQVDYNPLIELTVLIAIGFSIMIFLYEFSNNSEYADLKRRIIMSLRGIIKST